MGSPSDPVRIVEWDEKVASPGLSEAIFDSLAYRIAEIEKHFHSKSRVIPATITPIVIQSGANAWGTAVQILAAGDTPIFPGNKFFDPDTLIVVSSSIVTPYRLRLIWGTGTSAAAILDDQFSETIYCPYLAGVSTFHVIIRSPRIACGSICWIQCWNATNLAALSIFASLHEYEG